MRELYPSKGDPRGKRSMWLLVEVCPLLISVGSQRTRAAFRALGFDAPIPR